MTPDFDAVMSDGRTVRHSGTDQIFTFRPTGSAELLVISVRRLIELHEAEPHNWETLDIEITAGDAELIGRTRGTDVSHINRTDAERAGYGCFQEDGSFLWSTATTAISSDTGSACRRCGFTPAAGRIGCPP